MKINKLYQFVVPVLLLLFAVSLTTAAAQETRKIDEYGAIRSGDEKARLDNFAVELQNDPAAQGYLVTYGGRRSRPTDSAKRGKTAKTYLVKIRKMKAARVITVDGGYREEVTTELWLVPSGGTPPYASPTVDPSEVQPPKAVKRKKVVKKKIAPKKRKA